MSSSWVVNLWTNLCQKKLKSHKKKKKSISLFKVILHQLWVKNISPWKFNLEYGGPFIKLFMHVLSRNMFPTTRNLQIRACLSSSPLLWRLINFRLLCSDDCRSYPREEKFWSDDCRSWPREEKINNHECWGKHAHIPDNDYWGICLFHVVWTIFFWAIRPCSHIDRLRSV